MKHNLYLEVNQEVKVDGVNYIVEGWIEFSAQSDGCSWCEYKLKSKQGKGYKWLSIDENYDEYAIYEMTQNRTLLDEATLSKDGYKQVDSDKAKVLDCSGNVDVARGDYVRFKEYEDQTEEKIRAMECWDDETEYATGYYLDADEIIPVSDYAYNGYQSAGNRINQAGNRSGKGNSTIKSRMQSGLGAKGIIILIVLFGLITSMLNGLSTTTISKYLEKSSSFTYVTSITSDINVSEKADVYKTTLSVQSAAEDILKQVAKKVTNVDEDSEGGTVTILTSKEYALVYTSEDNETLVQVSSRGYTYSSRNTPYHANTHVSNYYRRYYYTKGYESDSKRYKNATSGYEDYEGGAVEVSTSSHYKDYTNTIKQQSTASRSSSGGGTSSGK